jgi:hypothetical protein
MPELGIVEPVDVRQIWPHEAHDFTPWLVENLDLLSKSLDLDLEYVQREVPVGDFSLDILARNRNTGEVVAIENQLEWTDHTHLGQILTYAAGNDARIVIWVTPKFREEHRAAIDWLNHWTPEEIAFFGVEVSAIRIGDSLPAPEFRAVAFPNGWSKQAKQKASNAFSNQQEKLRQFFIPLSQRLRDIGFANRVERYQGVPRFFPSGFSGISYTADLGTHMRAYIWINMGSGQQKHRFFDALQAYAEELEGQLKVEWFWNRHGNYGYASCGIQADGSIEDPQEKLKEHEAWLLEYLPKLKEVLTPYLEDVMASLQSPDSAGVEG